MCTELNPHALHHAAQRAAKALADDLTAALKTFAQRHRGKPAVQIERMLRRDIAGLDEAHYKPLAQSIALGDTPAILYTGGPVDADPASISQPTTARETDHSPSELT